MANTDSLASLIDEAFKEDLRNIIKEWLNGRSLDVNIEPLVEKLAEYFNA